MQFLKSVHYMDLWTWWDQLKVIKYSEAVLSDFFFILFIYFILDVFARCIYFTMQTSSITDLQIKKKLFRLYLQVSELQCVLTYKVDTETTITQKGSSAHDSKKAVASLWSFAVKLVYCIHTKRYSEIPLLRPPEIKTSYLLKTLFAKFKLFFSSFSTPSVLLIRDHLWDCPKVVFKTTFGQSQTWS